MPFTCYLYTLMELSASTIFHQLQIFTLLRQSGLRSQGLYYGGVGKALWLSAS